jgi:3-hydroxy-9,10-secoandrosta-1,3,5(10)-triene-9,17-dione monooxygenase reductase component
MTVSSQPAAAPAPRAVAPPDEAAALKDVFGCFATGVVVVTASGPSGPVGMTVSSFTSVSLRPPLVLFCAAAESTTWPQISRCGTFVINILACGQGDLARAFARRQVHRFAGIQPFRSPTGLPVLPEILAYLECQSYQLWPGGDHTVVVGQVRHAQRLRDDAPLLHFGGRLR